MGPDNLSQNTLAIISNEDVEAEYTAGVCDVMLWHATHHLGLCTPLYKLIQGRNNKESFLMFVVFKSQVHVMVHERLVDCVYSLFTYFSLKCRKSSASDRHTVNITTHFLCFIILMSKVRNEVLDNVIKQQKSCVRSMHLWRGSKQTYSKYLIGQDGWVYARGRVLIGGEVRRVRDVTNSTHGAVSQG